MAGGAGRGGGGVRDERLRDRRFTEHVLMVMTCIDGGE